MWVAEGEGGEGIIGHIVLSRSEEGDAAAALWSGGPTAVINRLYVDPAARGRGRGVGAALMERAVAEAELRALHPVLDVASSDTAAALYERLGWTLLAAEVEQEWGPGQRVTGKYDDGCGSRAGPCACVAAYVRVTGP